MRLSLSSTFRRILEEFRVGRSAPGRGPRERPVPLSMPHGMTHRGEVAGKLARKSLHGHGAIQRVRRFHRFLRRGANRGGRLDVGNYGRGIREKRYRPTILVIFDIGALSELGSGGENCPRAHCIQVGEIWRTNNYSIRVSFLITEGHRVRPRFRKSTSRCVVNTKQISIGSPVGTGNKRTVRPRWKPNDLERSRMGVYSSPFCDRSG